MPSSLAHSASAVHALVQNPPGAPPPKIGSASPGPRQSRSPPQSAPLAHIAARFPVELPPVPVTKPLDEALVVPSTVPLPPLGVSFTVMPHPPKPATSGPTGISNSTNLWNLTTGLRDADQERRRRS